MRITNFLIAVVSLLFIVPSMAAAQLSTTSDQLYLRDRSLQLSDRFTPKTLDVTDKLEACIDNTPTEERFLCPIVGQKIRVRGPLVQTNEGTLDTEIETNLAGDPYSDHAKLAIWQSNTEKILLYGINVDSPPYNEIRVTAVHFEKVYAPLIGKDDDKKYSLGWRVYFDFEALMDGNIRGISIKKVDLDADISNPSLLQEMWDEAVLSNVVINVVNDENARAAEDECKNICFFPNFKFLIKPVELKFKKDSVR